MQPPKRIQVLPDLLVKKIAAGEVVERPSSVVKELLDNAIDAGARRISITIADGGKELIRVTDDGHGMSKDDLALSVTPHATSKLINEDDLYSIATLGFRGEALASISSVSKLRILTRHVDSIEGHELRVAAQRVESSTAAGCPVGTTVEVRDLFFNVPARRKFLRAASTEVGRINDQLTRVALPQPHIAFDLTNNGRVTQKLPVAETYLQRIAKMYGPELVSSLLTVQRDERGIGLEAYIAPPAQSRATAQWQYTFVNGRPIRDRFVQHAIKESYRGLMEPNRHGVVFLFLTLDPQDVDVNVHPTKIEVRWADPNLIHSQVLSAMRETFQRADLTPALRTNRAAASVSSEQQHRVRNEMASLLKSATPIEPGAYGQGGSDRPGLASPARSGFVGGGQGALASWQALYDGRGDAPAADGADRSADHDTRAHQQPNWPGSAEPSTSTPNRSAVDDVAGTVRNTPTRAIQMHNLYLVAETDDGIVIVDQHALHERVLYEQFRARITAGPLESQRLLLPETIAVTRLQADLLEQEADLLARLGIEVSPFGDDSVAIHSFPALLKDTDVAGFMRDLLDYLAARTAATTPAMVLDRVLSMMACKAAVKAGDPLTSQEIDALFAKREYLDQPSSCPHGRPTMLHLSRADLDRQFHRT